MSWLWPALSLVVLMFLGLNVPGWIAPATFTQFLFMFYTPLICSLLFLFWWLRVKRIPRGERWTTLGLVVLIAVAVVFLSDKSIGLGFIVYGLPALVTAWTIALFLSKESTLLRRSLILLAAVLSLGSFTLLRFDGLTGGMASQMAYRWSKTSEQLFLESRSGSALSSAHDESSLVTPQPGDWMEFRGTNRDSRVSGQRIRTDWSARPPKEIWKQRIGPGWSSFAIVGGRAFTQEQRGEKEVVVCYNAETGKEIWIHTDQTRFEEPVAGAGPRATPTFAHGKLFSLGASGHLNALDAATGKLLWTHDLVKEFEAAIPMWGFSSSPLVDQDRVAVFAGNENKGVLAFSANDGKLLWHRGKGGHAYTSIHRARIAGRDVWLNTMTAGLEALNPADGASLWLHEWDSGSIVRCIQPAVINELSVAVGTGLGVGTRLISIEQADGKVSTAEKYTSTKLKPYFNDFVIHRGCAFGFDGVLFTCFDLATGKTRWKAGRYGSGQVLLIVDQELLLVISEQGQLVLIKANPDKHEEIAKFSAVEGKTWNHPVLVRGRLYVRNAEFAACYDVVE